MATLVKVEAFLDQKFLTVFSFVSVNSKNSALLITLGKLSEMWCQRGVEPDRFKISLYCSDEWRFLPKVVPMGEEELYLLEDFVTLYEGRYFKVMAEKRGPDVFVGTNLPVGSDFESVTAAQKLALFKAYEKLKSVSTNLENLRWKKAKKVSKICAQAETELDSILEPFDLHEKRSGSEVWGNFV